MPLGWRTHRRSVAVAVSDIAAVLTGEHSLAKYTGGRDHPSRDEIARLAYHFFETRGRQHGNDVDDWLAAEQELAHHYR
jgi:hypothetical protein